MIINRLTLNSWCAATERSRLNSPVRMKDAPRLHERTKPNICCDRQ